MAKAGRSDRPAACFIGSAASFGDYGGCAEFGDINYFDINEIIRNLYVCFDGGKQRDLLSGTLDPLIRAKAVWYHPGSFEELEFRFAARDTPFGFARRQFAAALGFFEWWLQRNCRCIDEPANQRRWSNKLVQLAALGDGSAVFPRSFLVCGKPPPADAGVIKHVGESRRLSEDREFLTRRFSPADRQALASNDAFPMLVQDAVDSPAEFRTFMFGRRRITVRFSRTALGQNVDIHSSDVAMATASVDDLPAEAGSELDRIQAGTGLKCLAADYMMESARFRLLEINPLFAWSHLPKAIQTDVSRAAYSLLA